jgi:6-phosphofructokinase 1
MVVEVMGRDCGWIALNSGISGGADVILIPEIPFYIDRVCEKITDNELHDKDYAIVVVAEGATAKDSEVICKSKDECEVGRQEVLLGGIGEWVAKQIKKKTGKDTRHIVLGHMVALATSDMKPVPLAEAIKSRKKVPLDNDKVLTAREIGICLGERLPGKKE